MATTIKKCAADSRYTKISNVSIQDERLSLKSRGLLAYLLSLPANWEICLEHLYTVSKADGRHAIRTGLNELKKAGYMSLQTLRDAKTQRFTEHSWTVYDTPESNPDFKPKQPALSSGGSQKLIFGNLENQLYGKPATTKEIREKGNKDTKEGGPFYGGIIDLERGKPADQEAIFNRCLSLGLSLDEAEFAKANISPKGMMLRPAGIPREDMEKAAQIWRFIRPKHGPQL